MPITTCTVIVPESTTDEQVEIIASTQNIVQQTIIRTGCSLLALLLHKNKYYGSSVFFKPLASPNLTSQDLIKARISDKLQRLVTLIRSSNDGTSDESKEDTYADLVNYSMLLYIAEKYKDDIEFQQYVDQEFKKLFNDVLPNTD